MPTLQNDRIIELIQRQGTIQQVTNFLRAAGLTYSAGSWDDLILKRLRPLAASGDLSQNQLLNLLSQVEDYGHQHIFLFRATAKADLTPLFSSQKLRAGVAKINPKITVGVPSFEDMPSRPALVEVRTGWIGKTSTVTFKIVEKRTEISNRSEAQVGSKFVVTYDSNEIRAVNTARFWENGLAEIRIFSQNDAIDYTGLARAVWSRLDPLVSEFAFVPLHLTNVRKALWAKDRRKEITEKFLLKASNHKNGSGNRIAAAAGPVRGSMLDDKSLVASVDEFNLEETGSYVDRAVFSVRADGSDGQIARDISLILHGEVNELIIGSRITEQEYEHILAEVLRLAKTT